MFPIPWNFPFKKKDGSLTTIDAAMSSGGGGYELPTASGSTKGGVKIGTGLTMTGEVLSNDNPTPYELPTAAADVLGGVKVGTNLSIDENGVLSASGGGGTPYTLPTASGSTKGGVKIGTGLTMTGEVLSNDNPTPYSLPAATASALGGIKVGSGLSVAADGTLSASGGGGGGSTYAHFIKISGTAGGSTSGSVTIYLKIVNNSSTAMNLAAVKSYLTVPGADMPYPCENDSYLTPPLGDKVPIYTLACNVNGSGTPFQLSINYYGSWVNIGAMTDATVTDIVF